MHIQQLMDTSGVRFGTSGARGLAVDMSARVCFAYTAAFLQVIAAPAGSRVALGMDLRPSSPDIAGACAAAIRHAGLEVDFCGVLPTPALAFHAQERGIPAIMVTGSHIPFDRNGIKFYRASGEITKADEAGIAAAEVNLPDDIQLISLLPTPALPTSGEGAKPSFIGGEERDSPSPTRGGDREEEGTTPTSAGGAQGVGSSPTRGGGREGEGTTPTSAGGAQGVGSSPTRGGGWEGESSAPNPAQPANPAASQAYLDRYLSFFPAQVLSGMRLGFYEHSSVARDLLRGLLESLGAQVTSLGRTDAFVPIDTEAVGEADIQRARAWSAEYGFDAILSTDGDADRPLIGDEQGNWLRGDVVGILCAQYLGADAVVTPVSSNTALEKCGAFARVERTRIGSPFVIAGMERLMGEGARRVVGFEANGGFLVGTRLEKAGRTLEALPTRDAVLPILALLAMAREQGVPLSRLPAALPPRYTASDRLQNFPVEQSQRLVQQLAGSDAALHAFLAPLHAQAAGLDQTDGLRITLSNGEIVHLRPSGNAPELRCYAEADSQEQANLLANTCLQHIQMHTV